MYTDYLKTQLTEIEALESEIARIREECPKTAHGLPDYLSLYVTMESLVRQAAGRATSALRWTTEHIVPAEAEAERLGSILEALGVDFDEETLATLELIGKQTWSSDPLHDRETSPYRDERRQIGNLIRKLVTEVQEAERDTEHDNATAAILAAGFVYDDENDCFARESERIIVTLVNGRESRYEWVYENEPDGIHVTKSDFGRSGEFSRLLALIAKPAASDALAPDSEARQAIQ